jgi:hypothetical protein
MRMTRAIALVAVAVLLTGCGTRVTDAGDGPAPVTQPTEVPAAVGEVRTSGPVTVLDDGSGPELCLGAVATSYPPQCGGPPITNWRWADHPGDFESSGGVRWGGFAVTGEFDGTHMTATDVVSEDEAEVPDYPETDLTSPCPEPEGGWGVLDPDLTTEAAQDETMRRASRLDTYAAAWVDQSINPAYPFEDENAESVANDPALLVINVQVTDDVEATEALLRETWGGALCVSQGPSTLAERRRVWREVDVLPGLLMWGPGQTAVEITVVYDDGSIRAWLDQEYGVGMTQVTSALIPVD